MKTCPKCKASGNDAETTCPKCNSPFAQEASLDEGEQRAYRAYSEEHKKSRPKKDRSRAHTIKNLHRLIAWAMILGGIVVGVIMGGWDPDGGYFDFRYFNLAFFSISTAVGVAASVLYFAVAEVISILLQIEEHTYHSSVHNYVSAKIHEERLEQGKKN